MCASGFTKLKYTVAIYAMSLSAQTELPIWYQDLYIYAIVHACMHIENKNKTFTYSQVSYSAQKVHAVKLGPDTG